MSTFIWTERAKEQLRAIDREQALKILHALIGKKLTGVRSELLARELT